MNKGGIEILYLALSNKTNFSSRLKILNLCQNILGNEGAKILGQALER